MICHMTLQVSWYQHNIFSIFSDLAAPIWEILCQYQDRYGFMGKLNQQILSPMGGLPRCNGREAGRPRRILLCKTRDHWEGLSVPPS